jgi:hypothetical protein
MRKGRTTGAPGDPVLVQIGRHTGTCVAGRLQKQLYQESSKPRGRERAEQRGQFLDDERARTSTESETGGGKDAASWIRRKMPKCSEVEAHLRRQGTRRHEMSSAKGGDEVVQRILVGHVDCC